MGRVKQVDIILSNLCNDLVCTPSGYTPDLKDVKMEIELGKSEVEHAAHIGIRREIWNYEHKHAHKSIVVRTNGCAWEQNIVGAIGEVAVAKALGIYYDGEANRKGQPDLGSRTEVRFSKMRSPSLIIRDKDDDDSVFILVSGGPFTSLPLKVTVHGWMLGKNGKKKKWLKSPGKLPPAYFVPIDKLKKMSSLPEVL